MFKRILLAAALTSVLSSCGGGGSPEPRSAGVYWLDGPTIAVVIVDGAGNLIAAATQSGPGFKGSFLLGGQITRGENGSWALPAAVYFERPGGSNASVPSTISGTFSQYSISFTTPGSVTGFPATIVASLNDDGFLPASLPAAVGRYVARVNLVGGGFKYIKDLTVDADARISGVFAEGCNLDGTLSVIDPAATVYTVTGTLTGPGCPEGSSGPRLILGTIGVDGTSRFLHLYALLDSGSVFTGLPGTRQ